MKILYTLLAVFAATGAFAQPTLTQSSNFVVGEFMEKGLMYSVLAPNVQQGSAGPSQTWNFNTLQFDAHDTMIGAVMPSQYVSAFPGSNIAIDYGTATQDYNFCTANSSGFYFNGGVFYDFNFGPQVYTYSNPISNMEWPISYNSTFVDTGFSDFKYPTLGPTDSAWQILTIVMNVTADAWGTLTMSWGTETVLRLKREVTISVLYATHDTVTGWGAFSSFTDQNRTYEFWSPNYNWSIASLNVDFATDTVQSYDLATIITDGFAENVPQTMFGLHPNPATTFVTITGAINSRWEIVDAAGRAVKSGVLRDDVAEISVEDLARGIYVMSVTDENGTSSSRKFVVE